MPAGSFPLRFRTQEQFAALRDLLRAAEYTESSVCRRLGIDSFLELSKVMPGRILTAELAGPLDALIRLFLECEPMTRSEIESWLGVSAFTLLCELDLLRPDAAHPEQCISPVGLHPTQSLYLVCDRGGELASLAEDVVYPAILENTQYFLGLLPATPCRTFLDLGTGTGVAALMAASRYAEHAWACDITERSVHFSEFNRRLNGLENVTVARGDLYEPVEGRMFDRIVTHPPYVPVASSTCVFRDGGQDGEQIVRRIIEGLPRFLSPGGRFYCQTLASDREEDLLEERIRKWLGEREAEFDLALITETAREPADFIGRAMQKGTHRREELEYWSTVFRELKVKFLVYGCILIQRKQEDRAPFTVRVQKGPHSGLMETEWLLNLHTAAWKAGARLLDSRPSKSDHLHLAVLHSVRDGELVPEEFMFRVTHPFEGECKCAAWIAALVGRCDGETSGWSLFEDLKQAGTIHPESSADEFALVLRALVSAGYLEIEPFGVPSVRKDERSFRASFP